MLVSPLALPLGRITKSFSSASWFVLTLVIGAALPALAADTSTTTSMTVTSGGSAAISVPSGTAITLTAAVSSGANPVTLGQVRFCDASAAYCTDIHLLGTAQLTAAGAATYKFVPGIGSHSYKAEFLGTTVVAPSSSSPSALAVTGAYPSTTALTQSGGTGNYTLTAAVGGNTAKAPTGQVSFVDTSNNNLLLGTAPLGQGMLLGFVNTSNPIASAGPLANQVADVNGDGVLDVVVLIQPSVQPDGSFGPGSLGVVLGNGDGTFKTPTSFDLSFSPVAVAVGDLNMDGKPDLVVAGTLLAENDDAAAFTAYFGNGDGTFTAGQTITPAELPNGVAAFAIADFNGDGKLDLVVTSGLENPNNDMPAGFVVVLLGNGDGTFQSPSARSVVGAANTVPTSIAVGDFNQDGKLDLVMSTATLYPPETVGAYVLVGNGDGTFGPQDGSFPSTQDDDAGTVMAADFNGDGKLDIAVLGSAGGVFLGHGDGTFQSVIALPVQPSGGGAAVADFNGDGKPDLVLTEGNGEATILTGNGDGTMTLAGSTPSGNNPGFGTQAISGGDLNGDGIPDVVLGGNQSNGLSVYLTQVNQSTATLTSIAPSGTGIHQVQASYPGDSTFTPSLSANIALTASPTAPLTFAVPNHTYGDAPFTVAATSNSTGALTYSIVSGPATISGSTISLTGKGTVVVQASQAAGGGYNAATQAATFTVSPATLTISANNLARVFGAANPTFTGVTTGAVSGDIFSESFTTTATPASIVGTYPIVPTVTGSNLASYTVLALPGTLTVSQAGTTTTFALSNGNQTFTATVASVTSGTPTGSVSFFEGQTLSGTAPLTNGVAAYTAATLPAGSTQVTAQYGGDSNFTESSSPSITFFAVTPASTSLLVAQAGTVTDKVSLSAAPGYAGTVQLSCAGLPQNATCSFQPATVAFTGTNPAETIAVTIQTGVSTQAALQLPGADSRPTLGAIPAAVLWLPGLATTMLAGRRRTSKGKGRRKGMYAFMSVLLLSGMGLLAMGCGSSSSSTPPASTNTPAGTYAIQVSAAGTGGLSQTVSVNLIVQ